MDHPPKANVIGLHIIDGKVTVEELLDWMSARDAACAEYLVDALKEYMDTGEDVEE